MLQLRNYRLEGWLRLTGGHPYGFQVGDLKLTSSNAFEPPDESAVSGGLMGGAAINVGQGYAHLVQDLRADTCCTPGFAHGLHDARHTETVARAAEQCERQKLG